MVLKGKTADKVFEVLDSLEKGEANLSEIEKIELGR